MQKGRRRGALGLPFPSLSVMPSKSLGAKCRTSALIFPPNSHRLLFLCRSVSFCMSEVCARSAPGPSVASVLPSDVVARWLPPAAGAKPKRVPASVYVVCIPPRPSHSPHDILVHLSPTFVDSPPRNYVCACHPQRRRTLCVFCIFSVQGFPCSKSMHRTFLLIKYQ